jgi:hypothetical protein
MTSHTPTATLVPDCAACRSLVLCLVAKFTSEKSQRQETDSNRLRQLRKATGLTFTQC